MAKNHYDTDNIKFEDVSSYSSSKEYKKKKKNRRGRTILKSILALFSVILIVAGGGMIYLSTGLLSGLNVVSINRDAIEQAIDSRATMDDSITNIALFGIDARDGSFSGLADSIIVISIDNKHGKIKMTSILRDSKVVVAGYGGSSKINATYSSVSYPNDGGPELAIRTINQNFLLNITDYVTINFTKLAEVVDAFGGTTVTLTDEEAYQTNKNLNSLMYEQIHDGLEQTITEEDFLPEDENGDVKGGTLTLTGNQAVAYARNRSDSDDNRADRQKKVLMGLFDRLANMSTSEYYSLADVVLPKCETSLDFSDIWSLAPILATDFEIEHLTIPGSSEAAYGADQGDGIGWVYEYDLEAAAEHIDRFIYEDDSQYWDEASGNGADVWEDEE